MTINNVSLKGWLILPVIFFAILIFDSCHNEVKNADVVACDVNLDNLLKDKISFDSVFCDLTFIPLENKREGMLSFVSKMIVTKDYYIVFDFNTHPQVILFNHDGDYKGTVGRLGHGRGEYEYIFDLSVDMDGNIILDSFDEFMIYDSKGKFIRAVKRPMDSYVRNILCYRDGMVCATNYSDLPFLLYFLDKDYKQCHKMLSSNDIVLGNPPRMKNALHVAGDTLCYFNPYTSEVTLVDLLSFQAIKQYSIVSENMLNMEKAQTENSGKDIDNLDAVFSYYLHDGKIVCYLTHNVYRAILEIDTKTDEFSLSALEGWFPEVCDVHDQYYYSILSQEEFLELVNGKIHTTEGTRQMVSKACKSLSKTLTARDNYVIVRAKKR